jgi:hypothetical protein
MAFDFDLFPAKSQVAPASSTKFGAVHIPINAALTVGMLALNKVTRLTRLPKGFVLTGLSLIIPDMDTNGAPALVFSIGDAATPARLISVSTKAQAGGTLATADLVTAAMLFEFTANTDILWTTTTAAATAAAGTVKGILSGYVK